MAIRRTIGVLGIAMLALGGAAAPQDAGFAGEMTLTHGYVRARPGKFVSVAGMRVPFHARQIASGAAFRAGSGGQGGADGRITVYHNNNGENSYFFSPGMPSALDDVTMLGSGQGAPWERLTVGLNADLTDRFLIRWIVFDTFVSGRGAGRSAFDGVLADFGGFFSVPEPGAFQVTFDISVVGVSVADGGCYLATQFREPDPTGEGPFVDWVQPVFSGGGPAYGSSEDRFWYDSQPAPDGTYDELEQDYFGGPPNEANFLLVIEVNGTQENLVPSSYTLVRGRALSGGLVDLWYSDDSYLRVQVGVTLSSAEAPVQVVVESVSPVATVTSLKFKLEAAASVSGLTQRMALYSYASGQWVELDSRGATTGDSTAEVIVTSNPSQYIEAGTRRTKARLTWKAEQPVLAYPWSVRLDQTVWTVVRP